MDSDPTRLDGESLVNVGKTENVEPCCTVCDGEGNVDKNERARVAVPSDGEGVSRSSEDMVAMREVDPSGSIGVGEGENAGVDMTGDEEGLWTGKSVDVATTMEEDEKCKTGESNGGTEAGKEGEAGRKGGDDNAVGVLGCGAMVGDRRCPGDGVGVGDTGRDGGASKVAMCMRVEEAKELEVESTLDDKNKGVGDGSGRAVGESVVDDDCEESIGG